MKKLIILTLLFVLVYATPCEAAVDTFTDSIAIKRVWLNGFAWTGHVPKDRTFRWAKEVEDRIVGTTSTTNMYFTPTDTEPTASEGRMYYDLSEHKLKFRNASAWVAIEAGSTGNSLDGAYNVGSTIDVDTDAVTMTVSSGDNNAVLSLAQDDATNDPDGLLITMATDSDGNALNIDGVTSGTDINADNWSILNTGVITLVGAKVGNSDLVFTEPTTNDVTLLADGDAILTISATSKEDLDINLATANTLTLTSSTGVDKVNWGDLDAHSGLAALTGDAGADFAISAANTGTFNLTVSQTGTGDNELRLASAGTATNAIAIAAATGGVTVTTGSGANGDVLITSGDDILITTGDDFEVTSTVGSLYKIAVDDTAADTITIGSAKDTSVLTGISTTIGSATSTAATIIQSGTGDLALTSTDDITLTTNTTTTDNITLTNTPGTADDAIVIVATAGGIDVDAAKSIVLTSAEAQGDAIQITTSNAAGGVDITSGTGDLVLVSTDIISLTVNTAATDNIILTNTPGTAVDAIEITATAGGIKHTSADVASTWTHTADGAGDDLSFIVAGAFDGSIVLTSSGTAGNAIDINTSAGGIDIDMAGGVGGEDFDILTATSINFKTTETAADQFKMDADGAHAGNVINLETTDGGILLNADGGDNGDIGLDAADDMTLTAAGDLTLAVTGTFKMGNVLVANNRLTTVVDVDSITLTESQSGAVIIMTQTGGAGTVTLPEATASNVGMWFIIIDANVTGGRDLSVDPEGIGSINGAAAGNKITNSTDVLGDGLMIFSTAADVWYTALLGHTTAWTPE